MTALSSDELGLIDEYWRAANYLSVGQIYLLDNPLLREPAPVRAHQTPIARALGYHARAEPDLRAYQPDYPQAQCECHLHNRPGPRQEGRALLPTLT